MDVSRWSSSQLNAAERLVVKADQFLKDARATIRALRRAIDEADGVVETVNNSRAAFEADAARVQAARELLLSDENALVDRIAQRVAAFVPPPAQ